MKPKTLYVFDCYNVYPLSTKTVFFCKDQNNIPQKITCDKMKQKKLTFAS